MAVNDAAGQADRELYVLGVSVAAPLPSNPGRGRSGTTNDKWRSHPDDPAENRSGTRFASWWPKPQRDEEIRRRRRADAEEAARAIELLIEQEGDRRVAIWLRVRLGGERMTTVAAEYGYRDGSGADRVIKRLAEKANSDRALSRRLKAPANEVSSFKS